MTELILPLRIGADGAKLPPSGIDPYALPWVQGASSTVHRQTRDAYAGQVADLREKLDVLRSKGTHDDDWPLYGPRVRPRIFRTFDQRPLPEDGWGWDNLEDA